MSSFIELTGNLKPLGASKFALLDDFYLKGGLRVLENKKDLENLDSSKLKKGMLVYVVEDDTLYECSDFSTEEDEFGDVIVTAKYNPFNVYVKSSTTYVRPTKNISFSYTGPDPILQPVDMGCRSFIMTKLQVSSIKKIKLQIFTTFNQSDVPVFEFDNNRSGTYSGTTYLQNKSKFQYKKYMLFINKETTLSQRKLFLFKCFPYDLPSFNTSSKNISSTVTISLTYIPLDA